MERLNECARRLFYQECLGLVDNLNLLVDEDQPKLYIPAMTFGRQIGDSAGQPYSVHGDLLGQEAYARHLEEVLPTAADTAQVQELMREAGWIDPKKAGAVA